MQTVPLNLGTSCACGHVSKNLVAQRSTVDLANVRYIGHLRVPHEVTRRVWTANVR